MLTLAEKPKSPPRTARPIRFSCLVCLLAAFLAGPAASPAVAQSQGDLRRENQRLRTQTEDLQRELTAALAELEKLKAEVAALRRGESSTPATGAPGAESPAGSAPPTSAPAIATIDETDPHSSPRGLFRAIVADYEKATMDAETGASRDDAERISFMRKLRHWATGVNRTFKGPVQWHVRMNDKPERVGRGYVMKMTAVDPKSGVDLGDPFPVFVSRAIVSRLKTMEQRFGLEETFVLKGALEPQVWINESRTSEGPFNNPRYVGLFAEFGFNVNAASLLPPPRNNDRDSQRQSRRSGD